MGIRFYCPSGHKLNVKTFLAGKRGICPRCGAKFEIPLKSVRAPGKRRDRTAAEAAPTIGAALESASIPPGVETVKSGTMVGAPIGGGSGAGLEGTANGTAAAGRLPPVGKQSAELPIVPPFAPINLAGSQGLSLSAFPAGAMGNLAAMPMAANRSGAATASPADVPDPIAEAPAAIWYVRPASGGQFGPAAGDVMRQWLAQRRVGADSMLWREGWTDWKKAALVFPALSGGVSAAASAAPNRGAGPASGFAVDDDWVEAIIDTKPSAGNQAGAAVSHSRSRGKQSNTLVIVSFILILLCILLGTVMVTVIMRQGRESDSSSLSAPPARATIQLAASESDTASSRSACQPDFRVRLSSWRLVSLEGPT